MNKKTYTHPDFETHKVLTDEFAVGSSISSTLPGGENEVDYPGGWTPAP